MVAVGSDDRDSRGVCVGGIVSRFYVGQPVTCVWTPERWRQHGICDERCVIPVLGKRYVVASISQHPYGLPLWGVGLQGMNPFSRYIERGFEPITENQVQAIIAMATDIDVTQPTPVEVENA